MGLRVALPCRVRGMRGRWAAHHQRAAHPSKPFDVGRLAQWKSARSAYGRSRVRTPQCPPLLHSPARDCLSVAQLVEHVTVDVCDHRVAGSIPAAETFLSPWGRASLAQSVERKALNLVVVGSSPTGGAFLRTTMLRGKIADGRTRTCAGRAQWISSPPP